MMDHLIIGEYDRIAARQAYVAKFRRRPPVPATVSTDPICVSPKFVALIDETIAELAKRSPSPAQRPPGPISGRRILDTVAGIWGVTAGDLRGPRRSHKFTRPRFVVMLLARDSLSLSSTQLGKLLGGRDHSTILSGIKRVKALLENDPEYRNQYEAARSTLEGK